VASKAPLQATAIGTVRNAPPRPRRADYWELRDVILDICLIYVRGSYDDVEMNRDRDGLARSLGSTPVPRSPSLSCDSAPEEALRPGFGRTIG